MSQASKATQGTNWGDMKRVLVEVQTVDGLRKAGQMDQAVDNLLAPDYYADLYSSGRAPQLIRRRSGGSIVGKGAPCEWLPAFPGACPPQFVLCAPREWFREGVPDYTGPIKGEKAGAK